MGEYAPTQLEMDAYVWCIRNKIFISPIAIREARWTIEISNNGIANKDPNDYSKKDIWQKVFQYYKHYFNKYENKI